MYTIGGTLPDYSSLNSAVLDLKNKGICGPVVFNIRPGTYYFSYELTDVLGSSNVNTITFQSENTDSTSVEIFKYTSNPLLKINGGKFFIFKQITLLTNSLNTNIKLYNNSSNITFWGCQILSNFQSSVGVPQIELSGGNIDNVSIINCKMVAQSQLYIYTTIPANANDKYDSLVLRNNEINWDHYNFSTPYAAEFNSLIYAEFSNNKFDFRGQVKIVADSSRYFNNRTSEPTYFYGSYFYIYNNFMSLGGSVYGSKVFFIHNSVHGIPTTTDGVLGVYDSSFVQNNIFYGSSPNGYLYDPNGNQSVVSDYINSDYNVFYSDGNYFTGNTIGNLNFAQWKAISGADSHSIVANPSFQNIDNLHTNNPTISIPSIPTYAYINYDIDGDFRDLSNPDPGADEFSTPSNTFDGGVSSIGSNSNLCFGMQNIKARIYNAENFISMSNAKINWSVNGIIQPFYNWYGLIAPADTSGEIIIGNYNFSQGNNALKIWITEPNGFSDSNQLNDTIVTISTTNTAINIGNDTIICEGGSLVLNAGVFGSYLWSTNDTSQSITINDEGVYFVTVTDSNSCVSIDSINIIIPIVEFGTDTTICSNTTIPLSASSNFISYLWSTGETTPSIVGSPGNTYWLQATSSNSCFSSDTISIGSNPAPQINLGNDTSICANSQIPLSPGTGFNSYLWNSGITNSTYYSLGGFFGVPNEVWVIVTNNYNCQSKDTINIYANEVNANITCTSNGAILDAGSGYQLYNWSGDNTSFYSTNQIITVTNPDTYTINAMDSNGCQFLSEYNINSFSPSAAFSYTANQLIVNFTCNTLGANYLWDFGDGNTSTLQNPSHTYLAAGNYNVTLSVTNDCGNVNSNQLVNVSTIGVLENESSHFISIYPNPNVGIFNVSFNGIPAGEYQISILNSLGQKVIEKSIKIDLKNSTYLIADENLLSGVYFIKIDSKEVSYCERIVILK
jgi:PKD repeat protein